MANFLEVSSDSIRPLIRYVPKECPNIDTVYCILLLQKYDFDLPYFINFSKSLSF